MFQPASGDKILTLMTVFAFSGTVLNLGQGVNKINAAWGNS
jgi:hypothetical protein